MNHKGMRQIPTFQGLVDRAKPTTRTGMATRLALLEHIRARLELELNVWASKCEEVERHLQEVRGQIEVLKRALYSLPAGDGEPDTAPGDGKGEGWREIPLRY